MRKPVVAAMCGMTVVVVGVAVRAGGPHNTHPVAGVAKAGVVAAAPPPTAAARRAATPRPSLVRRPRSRATTAPTRPPAVTPTRRAAVHVVRKTPPSPSPKPAVSTTVNGQAIDTRYGPVQVQIVVRSGRIIQANAIEYPQESSRDQEINSYAIPQLDQEAVQQQSAQIDTVSGATYTSDGYIGSLQSAIDSAHQAGVM